MNDKRMVQQYLQFVDRLNKVEAARQRVVERYKALEKPLAVDDPIMTDWDAADERVKEAKTALHSFLVANRRIWRP